MNQSRPRRLCRDGAAIAADVTGSDTPNNTPSLPIGRPRRSPSIRSIEWGELANGIFVRFALIIILPWLQAARGAQHHDRLVLLVFGRGRHLVLGQFERDAVTLVGDMRKVQRVPV